MKNKKVIPNWFTKEPIGFLAITLTLFFSVAPAVFNFISNQYFYDDKFNISCPELGEHNLLISGSTARQEVKCIISNNSGERVSIVSISPSIFAGKFGANKRLWLSTWKNPEELPISLENGTSIAVNSIFYILLPESVRFKDEDCIAVDDASIQGRPISDWVSCVRWNGSGERLLELFFSGFQLAHGSVDRTGLVIELGNGREISYLPDVSPGGFSVPNDVDRREWRNSEPFVETSWASKTPLGSKIIQWTVNLVFYAFLFALTYSILVLLRYILSLYRSKMKG